MTDHTHSALSQSSTDPHDDSCIQVLENTNPVVADLDCGDGDNPDLGKDICAVTDKDVNGFGEDTDKPSSYVLSLGNLSSTLVTSDTTGKVNSKVDVGAVQPGDDGDGSYVIRVSKDSDPNKTDNLFFSGTVAQGDSFTAAGSFGSATYVHIFDDDGTLLQTINFHTSCSSPLIIGDQYGSITLEGATLVGKDTGTAYTVGATETAGDSGVIYEITGGNDADDFVVDPATGVVTFKVTPDFENPTDSDGDNKYDVEVTAFFVDKNGIKTGEICEVKPLEVCVEDDCIQVLENTNPVVADLDCGDGDNPDLGKDICAVTDKDVNGFGEDTDKPSSYVLSLGNLSSTLVTSDTTGKVNSKVDVGAVQPGDDNDGSYVIRVSKDSDPNKTDNLFFSGTVAQGDSFTAAGSFGSATYVHIFDDDGTLLQTINFHTSCSSPLIIGDQYGSITLEGATLVGKDTGTAYTVGATETAGDSGVIYEITGGNDADDFVVDPATGVVTFKVTPDFENPTDSDGDNKYDVEVTAFFVDKNGIKTGEICEVKPLEVCVEDDLDEVCIDENTTPVVDLDLTVDCPKEIAKDVGVDICAQTKKETNGFGEDTDKPTSYELTLGDGLSNVINSSQASGKVKVSSTGVTDNDGTYFILVSKESDSKKTDKLFFSGDVDFGETFTASNAFSGESFGSSTYIHIFDQSGGQLLQTIEFHTSCSQPLVIGDQYGSVALAGATLKGKDTDTLYKVGGTDTTVETFGEGDIIYSIVGGADAALFTVDPDTGKLSFINPPDFENPADVGNDNFYDVIVRATAKSDPACFTDKPLEICVDDVPETGALSGRYFCDDNRNDVDDAGDTAVAGKTVTLLKGGVVVGTATTDATGNYRFDNLDPGTDYVVMFEDPTAEGKTFVDPDVGTDDTVDSDVTDAANGKTAPVTVVAGQETKDVDAGVEKLSGALSGTYFCDEDRDGIDDGSAAGDLDVSGKTVMLFEADGVTPATDIDGNPIAPVLTDGNGDYRFDKLAAGDYVVMFEDSLAEGKSFIAPNVGTDDTVDSDVTDAANGKTAPVTVVAGQETKDVDAGVEKLPGSLSGRYFCDTNNNDVDDGQATDPGIAGVLVLLRDPTDNSEIARTFTADDGTYSFGNLLPGTYRVVFRDPNGVLEGKQLVDPNVGTDDTIDSDAIGNTDRSVINGIEVLAGQNTPDNDAGAEPLPPAPGSLSGRYFCDTNDNDVDDGQTTDPGIGGVLVTLLQAGTAIATTTTAADGTYSFGNLAAGTYSVQFSNQNGVLDGKRLVTPNVEDQTTPEGTGDEIDSDAIGDTMTSTISGIQVVAGQDTPDNDAGAEKLNNDPTPLNDMGKVCEDELLTVDVLANDNDPDGDTLTVTAIGSDSMVGMPVSLSGTATKTDSNGVQTTISYTGLIATLTGNGIEFDASSAFGVDLDIGDEAALTVAYTVSDGNGGIATADIDLTFCGDANSIGSFCDSLPAQVQYQIQTSSISAPFENEAYDIRLKSSDARFDGVVFEDAYCLSISDPAQGAESFDTAALLTADIFCFEDAPVDVFNPNQISFANGKTALENLDVINWIMNQDFKGAGFSDWEIQRTIWELTDNLNTDYLDAIDPAFGSGANVDILVGLALDFDTTKTGEYMPGLGDKMGVILDPNPETSSNAQPFIIAVEIETYDCLC